MTIEVEDDGNPRTETAFPSYGCDRAALLQLEYRRRLQLDLDFGPWEQIFYGEFDGNRNKRVLVKVIGE